MSPRPLLTALLLLPLSAAADGARCAVADGAPGPTSYALGGARARQLCGMNLTDHETLDPWTGYRIDMSAAPTASTAFDALKSRTLARMESGSGITDAAERACARLTARLVSIHHPQIRLEGTGGADASYDSGGHVIRISNSPSKAYLLSEANLRKKLIHETLHLAQSIPEGRNPTVDVSDGERRPAVCATIHAYEQRAATLDRLSPYFPDAAACVLPEVPAACRNSVPDCVGMGGVFSPVVRRVALPGAENRAGAAPPGPAPRPSRATPALPTLLQRLGCTSLNPLLVADCLNGD